LFNLFFTILKLGDLIWLYNTLSLAPNHCMYMTEMHHINVSHKCMYHNVSHKCITVYHINVSQCIT